MCRRLLRRGVLHAPCMIIVFICGAYICSPRGSFRRVFGILGFGVGLGDTRRGLCVRGAEAGKSVWVFLIGFGCALRTRRAAWLMARAEGSSLEQAFGLRPPRLIRRGNQDCCVRGFCQFWFWWVSGILVVFRRATKIPAAPSSSAHPD